MRWRVIHLIASSLLTRQARQLSPILGDDPAWEQGFVVDRRRGKQGSHETRRARISRNTRSDRGPGGPDHSWRKRKTF